MARLSLCNVSLFAALLATSSACMQYSPKSMKFDNSGSEKSDNLEGKAEGDEAYGSTIQGDPSNPDNTNTHADSSGTEGSDAMPTTPATSSQPLAQANPEAPGAVGVSPSPSPSSPPPVPTPVPVSNESEFCKMNPLSKFSWDTITRPEEVSCFASSEAIFASLPSYAKNTFVLMKKSRSAQNASVSKPRVIVPSPDGTFILATATDGVKKEIEVAVYDYKAEKWQFAGIDYGTTPPKIETELCKSCHGSQPHPIWSGYPSWPGAYAELQKLSKEEAVLLNNAAKKTGDYPKIFDNFILQRSYQEGDNIYPNFNLKSGGHAESNEILGIVMSIKTSRSYVAKLFADPKVTQKDLMDIVSNGLCDRNSGTEKRLGYPREKETSLGMEGVDRNFDMWSGTSGVSRRIANEILYKLMLKDPDLKNKLPELWTLYQAKEWKFFISSSPKEFQAAMNDLQSGWYIPDFWVLNQLEKPTKENKSICSTLLTLGN